MLLSKSAEAASSTLISALPDYARDLGAAILQASADSGVPSALIAAVAWHESDFGRALIPQGPGGTGDNGHGRGLMQIDDRTWADWLAENDWTDPYTNLLKGAQILAGGLHQFRGDVRSALAAYNAGPGRVGKALAAGQDAGSVTTFNRGQSYPDNVLARLNDLGFDTNGQVLV